MEASCFHYLNGRLNLWTDFGIETVTVPFFYWTSHNTDNLPEYANVFPYGKYLLNKPNKGSAPNVKGRLIIPVTLQDGQVNWEQVKSFLYRVRESLAKREGYHSLLFKTFILCH